jgi:hypothetical protein
MYLRHSQHERGACKAYLLAIRNGVNDGPTGLLPSRFFRNIPLSDKDVIDWYIMSVFVVIGVPWLRGNA